MRRRHPPLLELQLGTGDAPVRQRRHRQRLHATGDQHPLHAGADLRGRVADRGQAARAVPVHRLAGNMLHARGVRRVAGEIATAVMRFGEDDVVDRGRVNTGPANDLGKHRGDECLGRRIDQCPLEGPADRCPGGTDDDGCGHVLDLGFGVNDFTKVADTVSLPVGEGRHSGSGTWKCSSRSRNASLVPCWARVLTKLNSPGANCRFVP